MLTIVKLGRVYWISNGKDFEFEERNDHPVAELLVNQLLV